MVSFTVTRLLGYWGHITSRVVTQEGTWLIWQTDRESTSAPLQYLERVFARQSQLLAPMMVEVFDSLEPLFVERVERDGAARTLRVTLFATPKR